MVSGSVVNKNKTSNKKQNYLWSAFEVKFSKIIYLTETKAFSTKWAAEVEWTCWLTSICKNILMSHKYHPCALCVAYILLGHKWFLPTFGYLNYNACSHTPHSWCSQLGWPSWNWAGCLGTVQRILLFPVSSLLSDSWSSAAWSPQEKLTRWKKGKKKKSH